MTPGRPLARGIHQELRHAVGAVDDLLRGPHLAAAVRHDARIAREELCQSIEITRLSCRHERGQKLRMFCIDRA